MSEARQTKLKKAVFLDRDGVINKLLHNVPDERHNPLNYVLSWDDFEFIPGALEGLKLLAETDYKIFVVSNQSGIGRGYAEKSEIDEIFRNMRKEIADYSGIRTIEHIFCSHVPDDNCCCRKPKPGMIYVLAYLHEIDLSQSWMIGDSDSDIHAGHNAEVGGLVKIVYDCREKSKDMRYYFVGMVGDSDEESTRNIVHIMPNLLEAVGHIIATSKP